MGTAERLESLRKGFDGPMSEAEVQLLQDFQGLIDFAIRNGLSFALVLSILGNDVNGIARHGMSVEDAYKSGFLPKAADWARTNADDVGEPDALE